jgi:hypothetical protein
VEETGVPGEKNQPAASHRQTLSHKFVTVNDMLIQLVHVIFVPTILYKVDLIKWLVMSEGKYEFGFFL